MLGATAAVERFTADDLAELKKTFGHVQFLERFFSHGERVPLERLYGDEREGKLFYVQPGLPADWTKPLGGERDVLAPKLVQVGACLLKASVAGNAFRATPAQVFGQISAAIAQEFCAFELVPAVPVARRPRAEALFTPTQAPSLVTAHALLYRLHHGPLKSGPYAARYGYDND